MDTLITPYGVTVDSFPAIINLNFNEIINYDKKEVEELFLVPFSFFVENQPQKYNVNVEITPHITDSEGNKISLLPVEELGLPPKYSNTWHSINHPVFVYKYNNRVIWGITANIIHELVYLLNSQSLRA